jgi:hypothetical protein
MGSPSDCGKRDARRRAFSPEVVVRSQKAFSGSWRTISFAFEGQNQKQTKRARKALAKLIVDLADDLTIDPIRLSENALAKLPPLRFRLHLLSIAAGALANSRKTGLERAGASGRS